MNFPVFSLSNLTYNNWQQVKTNMTTLGKIDKFIPATGDWTQYIERMNQFFIANKICEVLRKKAILLSSGGAGTYSLLRNLVAPVKPSDKSYNKLVRVMNEHQNPKLLVIMERYKFNKRDRQPGESIPFYVTELKRLSEHYDFVVTLEDMIRNRLVCGVRSPKIQQHLLAETELSFDWALKIASAMERAKKNVCNIEGSSELEKMEGLNKVQEKHNKFEEMGNKKGQDCFRCGGYHFQSQCSFKNAKCHNCGKIGHILRKCQKSRERDNQKTFQNSNHVLEEESNANSDLFHIYKNMNGKPKQLLVKVNLNVHLVEFEVDTGASLTVINSKTFDIIKSGLEQIERSKSIVKFKTFWGDNKSTRTSSNSN